jgi:hypothetical protein
VRETRDNMTGPTDVTHLEAMAMARKTHATERTAPLDLQAWIQREDQAHPGFSAIVDAELETLRLEDRLREARKSARLTKATRAGRGGRFRQR